MYVDETTQHTIRKFVSIGGSIASIIDDCFVLEGFWILVIWIEAAKGDYEWHMVRDDGR